MMRIRRAILEIGERIIAIRIWLTLPDVSTLLSQIGKTDLDYLDLCWRKDEIKKIDDFFSRFTKIGQCKGCISMFFTIKGYNKKLSWTLLKKKLYLVRTELNLPLTQGREIRIPKNFIKRLGLPRISTSWWGLREYATFYYLLRDKNI